MNPPTLAKGGACLGVSGYRDETCYVLASSTVSQCGRCRTKGLFFMGSKGNGKLCRDDVGAPSDLAISARESCFLLIPKVTLGTFSVCVLLGMGSNPAAVRVFRNRPPKDLRPWFRNYAFCMAWARILLLFGRFGRGVVQWLCIFFNGFQRYNVRHFFGVRFAWHGLESCCCSGVSEPASKGLAPGI